MNKAHNEGQDHDDDHEDDHEVKSDQQYFNSLAKYKPLCYSQKGTPIFMVNKDWWTSLSCLGFSDLIYIAAIILFLANCKAEKNTTKITTPSSSSPSSSSLSLSNQSILLINILILIFLNVSYLLTQFLNPGIINLTTISKQRYFKQGKFYCIICNADRTVEIKHCRYCEVCVEGLDHHCSFFNKCIAGYQKWAYYATMVAAFMGFIGVLSLVATIGM